MINEKICDWLMDNADAPIRYRVARELLKDEKTAKNIESELFEHKEVQKWLVNLRNENPTGVWCYEHGCRDVCLENALPKLVQLGLHGGLKELTDAAGFYFDRLKNEYSKENYPNKYTLRLAENMFSLADIKDNITQKMTLDGLDMVYDFVKKGIYDIYLCPEERMKLTGVPKNWKNTEYFIKPEIFNEHGFSYPLIYDIIGMFRLYDLKDPEIDKKITEIIAYISTDDFHNKISGGYGILVEGNGKYHGMGWDPKYPGWFDPASYIERGGDRIGFGIPKLLYFAQSIVKYPIARKTKWFNDLLEYLEKYKTDNDTYIFPKDWLPEKSGYAVNGFHLSFGENKRKKNWLEIESTFYVQLLKQYN